MMQPLRRIGRRGLGAWIVLGVLACTPPATPDTKVKEPATPVVTPTVQEVPIVPVVPTPTASDETLDGRAVIASNEGGWTRRRVGSERAMEGMTEGRSGPPSMAASDGAAGGGGSGPEPSIGSYGTLGKGGGGGSGEGYGYGGRGGDRKSAGAAAPTSRPPPEKAKGADTSPLKAGSTDDNADFKGYLKFLETWTTRDDVRGDFQPLDVTGRVFVKVVDGDGQPVPGVAVTVTDPTSKATVWRATTYGDGRAPYYPRLFGSSVQPIDRLEVAASVGGDPVTATWDGKADVTLAAKAPVAATGMALDVLFLIDTTGSMGDELDRIKTSLLAVTDKVRGARQDLKLRYAAVAYRDLSDEYVTMAHPFTDDTAAFSTALQALTAGGGGDLPESMNQGLNRAVEGVQWQPGAARVVFLVADAAPQMRFKGDILYGDSALRAVGQGIRVHSVAASGLDPLGTLVLRQIAQLTRGKFIFIEYGGTQATAAKHGVGGPVEGGNNLDDILLKQLTAEIEGWGK